MENSSNNQNPSFEEPKLQIEIFTGEEITADSYSCFLRDGITE